MKKHFILLILCLSCFGLSACNYFSDEDEAISAPDEVTGESTEAEAAKLYNQARDALGAKNYKEAISDFEEVERRYPFSDLAVRAQVLAAYTAYEAEEYEQTISILDRFVRMHPGNPSAPYAYYLMALCHYEQISDVGRDQKMTEKAMEALTEVVRRFPNTDYARDAKLKLDLTVDHLAGKEMEIGRYYQTRDEYLAAINRFRFVVENYQTTSHIPEALHRLVETYTAMGLTDEAKRYAAVLGYNYPSSIWYRDSYRIAAEKEAAQEADSALADEAVQKDDEGWLSNWF